MEGVVKCFNSNRGFGFIESEGKHYFVHRWNIQANSELEKGDKVFFEPEENRKGIKAVKVRKIENKYNEKSYTMKKAKGYCEK